MSEIRKSASHQLQSVDEYLSSRSSSPWTNAAPASTLPMAASSWTEDVGRRGFTAADEELHRLHETNLLLGEECSALKEVLNTKSLAANGECWRLREQVSTLFRENCSLKEHSAKVAIESKAIMKQLATTKQENVALRHRLAQFSQQFKSMTVDQLDSQKSPSSTIEQSDVVVGRVSPMLTGPVGQPAEHGCSLEQISNQLLQHLQREKFELEQQYTQMVEIQNYESDVTTSPGSSRKGTEIALIGQMDACRSSGRLLRHEAALQNRLLSALVNQLALKDTLQTVTDEGLTVQPQQNKPKPVPSGKTAAPSEVIIDIRSRTLGGDQNPHGADQSSLRSSLDALLDMYSEDIHNHVLDDKSPSPPRQNRVTNVKPTATAGDDTTAADNHVCPMCQVVFLVSVPLAEFEAHVMDHFHGDDFEIIVHDAADENNIQAGAYG